MSRTPSNVGGATVATPRYIVRDDQRKLIAQDAELALLLLNIGDAKMSAKIAGKDYGMADINRDFAAKLPDAALNYKRGKKAGQPRKKALVDAENANKAAALFRRVKVRYNSSDLLPTIQKLDTACGGSSTRVPTVEFAAGPIEVSDLL